MNVPEMLNSDATPAQSPAAGPESSAAIDVAHLIKLYKTTRAVDDVSFRIARGSITGLLGGNGAGKTTTIAMIMGLVLPTSGRVQVLGHAMPEQSAEVLGRMNFESPYVDMPMRLTVRQNLTIFGRLYAVKNLAERIEQLASDFDLKDFLDRANGKLSAGQKTRVALAKALINQPELLLLDEPTASLDPDTADWVRQHLQDYRKTHDATILLASHNMLEVERLCDRVIIMKRGRIEDDDSPDQIMARYNREHAGRSVPRCRARAGRGGGAMNNVVREVAAHRGISAHRIQRDGAALLVSADVVVAAAAGADLLAGAADHHLGLSAELHFAERQFLRARRRHADRRGDPVGHPVPRPARLLDFVSRGDVGAQPRQPDDEPVEADRIPDLADDHEPDPARDRRDPDDAAGAVLLRFQFLRDRPAADRVLLQPDLHQLVGRNFRLRPGAAQRAWAPRASSGR